MGPETGATVEVTYVGVLADASNGQVEDFRESGVLISSASEVLSIYRTKRALTELVSN